MNALRTVAAGALAGLAAGSAAALVLTASPGSAATLRVDGGVLQTFVVDAAQLPALDELPPVLPLNAARAAAPAAPVPPSPAPQVPEKPADPVEPPAGEPAEAPVGAPAERHVGESTGDSSARDCSVGDPAVDDAPCEGDKPAT